MQEPHSLSAEKVLKHHETTPRMGLSTSEAARRLSEHGSNELVEKGKKKAWQILLAQVKEVMILILLAAVVISGGAA